MSKKSLKRLLSGIMVLAVVLALCACGGGTKADNSSDNNSQEPAATDTADTNTEDASTEEADTAAAGEPTEGGSVTVGMTQDIVSLDPHAVTDAGTRKVVFNLYEGLVKPTSSGDVVPAVASDYSISDDATVYTFTLRDGITFHDGSAVTVEDIKYSIERYAEEQGDSSAISFNEVNIVDDSTVEIVLTEGNSEFLVGLANVYIIPESNADPAGNPIGTGPFMYTSYAPGENLVMAKYDGYWGTPAYLDEVTFKFDANVETAFSELQAGTLDFLEYLTLDQIAALSTDDFNILQGSMNYVHALFLNNDFEPFQNVLVRQAMNYAIDRETINEFLFGGGSHEIQTHMIPALSKYYNEETEGYYSYDPEMAKQLLEEAGYGDGFDLVITVPNNYAPHNSTAEIIVEELQAVGINATINLVEWSTWLSDTYQGRQYEATVVAFDGTLSPAEWFGRYTSDASNNMFNYSNEEFDSVYAQAVASTDDTTKVELYRELQMILTEDAASVYIEDPADAVALSSDLAGYEFYPLAAYDMSTIYYVK